MWSRSQRQSATRLFLRRIGMLAVLGIIIAALPGVWDIYQKEKESRELRAQAERERKDLLERQHSLQSDIANLRTDRGLEEALREQYALAQRGEHLIVIIDPSTTTPIHATSTLIGKIRRFFWPW